MLAKIYRDQFGISDLLTSDVLRETEAVFSKAINRGVPRSTTNRTAFQDRLKNSTNVFSVFKVHTQAQEIARQITDDQGNRRSFSDWAARVQPYLNHQNKTWLRTEYDTAIRRAHDEADWQRFEEDSDIYQCLEWVPTTSAHPGADHQVYWGTVLPIHDEFWTRHRPGDRWNCKCSLRQTNRRPTTPTTPRPAPTPSAPTSGRTRPATTNPNDPQPGLNTRPGSREIFSDDHVYYPDDCRLCPFAKEAGRLRLALTNLTGTKRRTLASNCHQCRFRIKCMEKEGRQATQKIVEQRGKSYTRLQQDSNYTNVKIDTDNGGLMATHKEHNFDRDPRRHDYGPTVQRIGFETGHKVILGKEDHTRPGVKNVEGTWDDFPFEISAREGGTPNNIRNGLKHCAAKPGCKVAVLYFPKSDFSVDVFETGLSMYDGLRGTSQWAEFDSIVCISGGRIAYIKKTPPGY